MYRGDGGGDHKSAVRSSGQEEKEEESKGRPVYGFRASVLGLGLGITRARHHRGLISEGPGTARALPDHLANAKSRVEAAVAR